MGVGRHYTGCCSQSQGQERTPARVDPRQPKVTIPEEEELSREGSEKEWRWDWREILSSRALIPSSQILGKDQQGGTFMNCILASDDNELQPILRRGRGVPRIRCTMAISFNQLEITSN